MKVSVEITQDTIESLIISAMEGGSNYWYYDLSWPKGTEYNLAIFSGYALRFKDEDGPLTLTLSKAKKGLSTLAKKYPHHFADILKDNADADTADAWLQCAIFGDIVYC